MSKAVIILGAGASAGFGVPTLRNLFKDTQARRYLKENDFLRSKLESLIWKPRDLDLESSHQGPTVEEILTLARDSEKQAYGLSPILNSGELKQFRRSLYVLIKKAVYD